MNRAMLGLTPGTDTMVYKPSYKINRFKPDDILFWESDEYLSIWNDGCNTPDEGITARHGSVKQKSNELVARMSGDELRDFERRIYPSACEVELDGQGRVVVPAKLRAYAKLEVNVTIAGVRDHMEIWDRETWQSYQERLEDEEKHIPF